MTADKRQHKHFPWIYATVSRRKLIGLDCEGCGGHEDVKKSRKKVGTQGNDAGAVQFFGFVMLHQMHDPAKATAPEPKP